MTVWRVLWLFEQNDPTPWEFHHKSLRNIPVLYQALRAFGNLLRPREVMDTFGGSKAVDTLLTADLLAPDSRRLPPPSLPTQRGDRVLVEVQLLEDVKRQNDCLLSENYLLKQQLVLTQQSSSLRVATIVASLLKWLDDSGQRNAAETQALSYQFESPFSKHMPPASSDVIPNSSDVSTTLRPPTPQTWPSPSTTPTTRTPVSPTPDPERPPPPIRRLFPNLEEVRSYPGRQDYSEPAFSPQSPVTATPMEELRPTSLSTPSVASPLTSFTAPMTSPTSMRAEMPTSFEESPSDLSASESDSTTATNTETPFSRLSGQTPPGDHNDESDDDGPMKAPLTLRQRRPSMPVAMLGHQPQCYVWEPKRPTVVRPSDSNVYFIAGQPLASSTPIKETSNKEDGSHPSSFQHTTETSVSPNRLIEIARSSEESAVVDDNPTMSTKNSNSRSSKRKSKKKNQTLSNTSGSVDSGQNETGKTVSMNEFQPTRRLAGEIAFQLDRRILQWVFGGKKDAGKRRYYGYIIQNIPSKIESESMDPHTQRVDPARREDMLGRFTGLLSLLRRAGYDINRHPDFTSNMVNKYGLLPMSKSTFEELTWEQADQVEQLLHQVVPEHELGHVVVLLRCLAQLAHEDGKPLFMW